MHSMNAHKPVRKRGTNVSLDERLVAEARQMGIGVSAACQQGLATAVKAEKERRWREENREAIDGINRWVDRNGLPLARYRMF